MERIHIWFDTDTPAFADSPMGESARILRALADTMAEDGLVGWAPILDAHGGQVGEAKVETIEDEDEDEDEEELTHGEAALREHLAEQAEITTDYESRLALFQPREQVNPRSYYVTMTWDDWPEGGSYGTVVMADDETQAEAMAIMEMAQSRAEECEREPDDEASDIIWWLEDRAANWHVVDCFPLDDFITMHSAAAAPLKTKVWTVVTNDDDGTPEARIYGSEAVAVAAICDWLAGYFDDEGDEKPTPENWRDAYSNLCDTPGFIDTISLTAHDIEVRRDSGLVSITDTPA